MQENRSSNSFSVICKKTLKIAIFHIKMVTDRRQIIQRTMYNGRWPQMNLYWFRRFYRHVTIKKLHFFGNSWKPLKNGHSRSLNWFNEYELHVAYFQTTLYLIPNYTWLFFDWFPWFSSNIANGAADFTSCFIAFSSKIANGAGLRPAGSWPV